MNNETSITNPDETLKNIQRQTILTIRALGYSPTLRTRGVTLTLDHIAPLANLIHNSLDCLNTQNALAEIGLQAGYDIHITQWLEDVLKETNETLENLWRHSREYGDHMTWIHNEGRPYNWRVLNGGGPQHNNKTVETLEKPNNERICYLAGPMAGQENHGYELFQNAENEHRKAGYIVKNPAKFDDRKVYEYGGNIDTLEPTSKDRAAYLKRDFEELAPCTTIVMLDGWEESTGANCELYVAQIMGLETWKYDSATKIIDTEFKGTPNIHMIDVHINSLRNSGETT